MNTKCDVQNLNDSSANKKCCSSCWAWRDGLAPLTAKGGGTSKLGAAASASDVGLVDDDDNGGADDDGDGATGDGSQNSQTDYVLTIVAHTMTAKLIGGGMFHRREVEIGSVKRRMEERGIRARRI